MNLRKHKFIRHLIRHLLVLGVIWTSPAVSQSETTVSSSQLEHLTGKKVSSDPKAKWDNVYNQSAYVFGKAPAQFLSENYQYIPYSSEVLDVGMGEGRNAIFLAQKGYKVTGIDLSTVAIRKATTLAKERNVQLKAIVGSAEKYEFSENSFDAIICFYFVDRELIDKMLKWLKPQGILIFEAYTLDQREASKEKIDSQDEYLKNSELLEIFKNHHILKFEEPLHKSEFTSSIIIRNSKK